MQEEKVIEDLLEDHLVSFKEMDDDLASPMCFALDITSSSVIKIRRSTRLLSKGKVALKVSAMSDAR